MSHSLEMAVADGTISAESAFCGLSNLDIARLASSYAYVHIIVRLRSASADDRIIMSIEELNDWSLVLTPRMLRGTIWYYDDIRDVLACPKPA